MPVLSKTATSASFKISKISGFLIKIPAFAAFEIAQTIAIGVARPSAHGQEMISTQIAADAAYESRPSSAIHAIKLTSAIKITAGTKIFEILSAKRAIGIFLLPASFSRFLISASSV